MPENTLITLRLTEITLNPEVFLAGKDVFFCRE